MADDPEAAALACNDSALCRLSSCACRRTLSTTGAPVALGVGPADPGTAFTQERIRSTCSLWLNSNADDAGGIDAMTGMGGADIRCCNDGTTYVAVEMVALEFE